MQKTIDLIDRLILEYESIERFFAEKKGQGTIIPKELSLTSLAIIYKKHFIISVASFFETGFYNIFTKLSKPINDVCLRSIFEEATDGTFFKYFNTKSDDSKNWSAGSFYKLFGNDFKKKIEEKKKKESDFISKEKAFLIMVNERNCLVHRNFIDNNVEKSFQELVVFYRDGIEYIKRIYNELGIDF